MSILFKSTNLMNESDWKVTWYSESF